jgi:hypothetical protein
VMVEELHSMVISNGKDSLDIFQYRSHIALLSLRDGQLETFIFTTTLSTWWLIADSTIRMGFHDFVVISVPRIHY